MRIVIINGQNHKGSTYHTARMIADKVGGDITEFFLPRDFGEFCIGCGNCFMKSNELCPHFEKLKPLTKAILDADLIILSSPVYVYHSSGAMKTFLDHYGYQWMVHRPNELMFTKQAVCVSTAAGAGMKSTNKDMKDSLSFWGVPKIYKCGLAVFGINYSKLSEKTKAKIDKETTKIANKIKKHKGNVKVGIKTKCTFAVMRFMQKKFAFSKTDKEYWTSKGWLGKNRPWK